MTKFSRSWKHDQVFISFRGESLRKNLVSNLIEEFKRKKINYFIDEDETRGRPITTLFKRIRESGVALILFSNTYPESYWCLDELAEIKKQVEIGNLNAFPVFYEVAPDSVKRQTGSFGSNLLKTADLVRYQVDRGSYESILETEAWIWGWREALVYIGGILGSPHKKGGPEGPLVTDIVKAVTSLLQALNLKKSVLKDLITKPSIHSVSMILDDLVFLDLISLKNPELGQGLTKHGQAGSIILLLLGSLDEFEFQPLLLSKKPQRFPGNKPVVSQEIQDQSYPSPVQVTNVLATVESNDNTRNRLGDDKNSDDDTLACFTFLCNIMKHLSSLISPPPDRAFISFGDKQLEKTLVSSLKIELEAKGISVYVENETKERIKESKVAIVVFSAKYPESPQCLDELFEIKKLMDAREIDPFPIFYKMENVSNLAQSVKLIQGWFLYRLLKIEQEVRKDVNRKSVKSILDTEARIWGWRQAIRSISSKPGFSNEYSSDPLFLTAVMTKVKEMFEFKDRPKKSSQMIEETPLMHQHDDLFYSLASLKRYPNLGLGMNHHSISRFEEPSWVLVSSQNHQYHINQVQNPSSRHVASPTTPQRSLLAFAPPDTPLGVADDTSSTVVQLLLSLRVNSLLLICGSPGLMLFPKEGGCVLYNPKKARSKGNWETFQGVDSWQTRYFQRSEC
ncbi:BnaC01g15240D [Brassica napus]|uniref:BnaC01g15240D protein n=1 Tax=Brassica napus TaxID=3708 RepID=A0A078FD90_BRANA|nr:BnaC01g15240D [Brassica napus]